MSQLRIPDRFIIIPEDEIMEVTKNLMPMSKKQFLMRQLYNHNITEKEYEERVAPLEQEIAINLKKALDTAYEELQKSMADVKNTTFGDGDIKRKVARLIIDFLKNDFTPREIKGVMRQGYKIMRTEVSDDED